MGIKVPYNAGISRLAVSFSRKTLLSVISQSVSNTLVCKKLHEQKWAVNISIRRVDYDVERKNAVSDDLHSSGDEI
jgi:hypothetical protein